MLEENAGSTEPGGLTASGDTARLTLSAVMQARRREQCEHDRTAEALLPPIIALASRARVPLDVIAITSRVSGVDEATVQNRLFAMITAGWVEITGDGEGRPRITDNDAARAAASGPTVFFGDYALPREELAHIIETAAAAEEAIASLAAAYPPRIQAAASAAAA